MGDQMKFIYVLFALFSITASAAMMTDGHYTGRCDMLLAVQYAKDSGESPLLQKSKTYETADVTVTTENGVQTQVWNEKLFGGGPKGMPYNFTVKVESTGPKTERDTSTYEQPNGKPPSISVREWKIEDDGSRTLVRETSFGKTKPALGYINEYMNEDGTFFRIEATKGFKAAGGTRVLSTRGWCVLSPDKK